MEPEHDERARPTFADRVSAALELVRAFMLPSALADAWAGLVLASLTLGTPLRASAVVGTTLASGLLYAAGMAANDLFDAERDRRFAPSRPIPAGRISPPAAALVAAALAGAGVAVALALGAGPIAGGVALLALAYDAGLKRLPVLGPVLMGLCRSGNWLLGAAAVVGTSAALSDGTAVTAAGALGVWIAAITAVSELEDRPPARIARPLFLRALPVLAVPLVPLALGAPDPALWAHVALLEVLLALRLRSALRIPGGAEGASSFVGGALGGIYLLDGALVLALAPASRWTLPGVAPLWALWASAALWRRARTRRGRRAS